MFSRCIRLLLILSLFFGLMLWSPFVETAPEEIKIGVVNVNKIFEGYSLTAEYEKQINVEFEEKMKAFQEMNEQIRSLQDELELFERGSQKWKDKNKELQQKIFYAAFFEKWEKQQFNDRLRDLTAKIYDDVRIAIEEYAKNKGYTLILKVEDLDLKSESRTELKLKINDRKVMYYKKSYDITNDIIKMINK